MIILCTIDINSITNFVTQLNQLPPFEGPAYKGDFSTEVGKPKCLKA